MENDQDFEIDPAIAASMGFSGFGNQNKKRKYGRDENTAFVDPGIAEHAQQKSFGTGANSIATGPNELSRTPRGPNISTLSGVPGATAPQAIETPPNTTALDPQRTEESGMPSLEALRHGIRNVDGDTVFFKPSFLEDPWRDLR